MWEEGAWQGPEPAGSAHRPRTRVEPGLPPSVSHLGLPLPLDCQWPELGLLCVPFVNTPGGLRLKFCCEFKGVLFHNRNSPHLENHLKWWHRVLPGWKNPLHDRIARFILGRQSDSPCLLDTAPWLLVH